MEDEVGYTDERRTIIALPLSVLWRRRGVVASCGVWEQDIKTVTGPERVLGTNVRDSV